MYFLANVKETNLLVFDHDLFQPRSSPGCAAVYLLWTFTTSVNNVKNMWKSCEIHVKFFTLWKMLWKKICEILDHVKKHVNTLCQFHMLFHRYGLCEKSCENLYLTLSFKCMWNRNTLWKTMWIQRWVKILKIYIYLSDFRKRYLSQNPNHWLV